MRTLTAAQLQVLTLPTYRSCVRELVDRGDGTMVDLSTFFGVDWIKTVKWGESVNDRTGTFTITFLREQYYNSIAPWVTGSQLNNQTGSYLPQLAVGRKVEIDTAVIAFDAEPQSGDWIVSFQGYIDTIDPAKTDYEVSIVGRDLGGPVVDRVAETSLAANPLSTALETSMQNDVINGIYTPPGGSLDPSAPTLNTPSSPGWLLDTPYVMQAGQGCLDQLSQMAEQIGWDVRFLWNNSLSGFYLTLWVPQRTPSSPDQTLQPYQITDSQQLETDVSWVRNVVSVMYGQTSPPTGGHRRRCLHHLNLRSQPIAVSSSTSIAKYGRRFCQIGLGATSNILDSGHASSLANAVLADLEDPIATFIVDLQFRPEVMLGDYYKFKAPTPWWDVDQSFGVQQIAHEFDLPGDEGDEAKSFTTLTCWGYPSASVYDWTQAMVTPGTTPPVKTLAPTAQTIVSTGSDIRGLTIVTDVPNPNTTDWYESQAHVATSSGFTPSATTLVDRGRKTAFKAS